MRPATILRWWFLALLGFTGLARAQPTPPVPGFDPDLVAAGSVFAISPLADGGVVIGGSFDTVAGVPRRHLAKIRADGSLDPDWNPSPDDVVFAISRPSDGAVFIAGQFRHVGGQRRTLVAKLGLEGDGSPDPDWRPELDGWFVNALAFDGDRILIGGYFDHVDRIARRHLARLHLDSGALDAAWSPDPDGPVYTIAVDAARRIYVGGDFSVIGNSALEQLARVSSTVPAVVDGGWKPAPDGPVTEILAAPGGELYVGGYFGNIGGQARSGLARLSAADAKADAWNPAPDAGVTSLALDQQAGILVAGSFTHIGTADQPYAARLHTGTGLADAGWNHRFDSPLSIVRVGDDGAVHAGGTFRSVGAAAQLAYSRIDPQGAVGEDLLVGLPGHASAAATDGVAVYLAGRFDRAQGQPRHNLVRMREDGSVDPQWRADTDAMVLALALQDQHLYLGGHFGSVAGTPRRHLARVAAAGNGALDDNWNPEPNGPVATLAGHEGTMYAGGQFDMIGQTARGYIARFGPGGGLDPQWNPAANSHVASIVVANSGVYAAGDFTSIGSQPYRALARLSASGTGLADAHWNASASSAVYALALDEAEGHLFAGGNFFTLGGKPRTRLAKIALAGSGAPVEDWSPAANATVRALALDGRGSVYAGGHFDTLAAQPQARLARLSSEDATVDPDWNPLVGHDAVDALMLRPQHGELLAAGSFATLSGERRAAVAALPLRTTHRLTTEAIGEGTVSPASRWVADGTPTAIHAVPVAGHAVEAVTASGCDIVPAGGDVWKTGDIAGDCHVTARFATATFHRVLVDSDAGGHWELAPGQDFPLDAVPRGAAVSLRIERGPEAHAVRVTGCGGDWVDDLYRTAPVLADCNVRIDFDLRPVVQGGHYSLLEDGWLPGVASAHDDGDSLHYSVRHAPDQGFVSLDGTLGIFEYQPEADYNGEDAFAVAASDASGPSSPAWFTIDVVPVNDAPTLTLDEVIVESSAAPGPRTRPSFATVVVGPEEEPGTQTVQAFLIETIDDAGDVLVDGSLAIEPDGTLRYALTGRAGTAAAVAKARDTGGVANGGIDTSEPRAFRIVVQPGPDLAVELRLASDTPIARQPFLVAVDVSNHDAAQGTTAHLDVAMPTAFADVAWACVPQASTAPCPAPPGDTGEGHIDIDIALPASSHLRFLVEAGVRSDGAVARFDAALTGAQDDDPAPANNAARLDVVPWPASVFGDGFEAADP